MSIASAYAQIHQFITVIITLGVGVIKAKEIECCVRAQNADKGVVCSSAKFE